MCIFWRNKARIHVDHRRLPKREDSLKKYLQKELRIFSTTADHYFTNTDIFPTIYEKLCNGCKIRVLLLDPESSFMGDRERQERTNTFKDLQVVSINKIKELKEKFPTLIELRFFNHSPMYQCLIIDDRKIFIAINIFGIKGTLDFPCLEIINKHSTKKLFEKFIKAFEELWVASRTVV